MRFNLLLGLLLCIFSISDINGSTLKKDTINPMYPEVMNGYQLQIKNLEVIRSLGKNVKLKYDIVNTGQHIVKLGKGRKIPNAMRIIFDDSVESNDLSNYKAQIAEQILNQDLFIQSGKSATKKAVKVNLNAPAKLAHLVGGGNADGSRLSENTVDKIKNGVGRLGKRNKVKKEVDVEAIEAVDEMNDLANVDDFGEVNGDMEIEEEVPTFSQYTEKVTEIDTPKPSTKPSTKRSKIKTSKKKAKKVYTEVVSDEVADEMLENDFEEEEFIADVRTKELPKVNEMDGEADFGTTSTTSTTIVNNPRSRGNKVVKKTKTYKEVESDDGTETHTIKRTTKRISATEAYPEDDSILANLKKKRKAKREAAKKEAMDMKASAAGSEVYEDKDEEIEKRELTAEELDTSEDLETERSKWYEGFKPYAAAEDFEEHQTYVHDDTGANEFLDKTTCPDLTLNDLEVVKMGKKWVTVAFTITNVGKGPARIYGTTPKENDNVYIKAFLSGSKKVSRGATTLGGMYVNKGVSNKAGKLMPDDSMKLEMKIDIRKKTKFTSVLILDLDAFGNCRECDETNNKQHVVLK